MSNTPEIVESGPVPRYFTITPADNTSLGRRIRGIYVGTTGDLTLRFEADGAAVLFANVPVGLWPFQAYSVDDTGTDATDLVGCE